MYFVVVVEDVRRRFKTGLHRFSHIQNLLCVIADKQYGTDKEENVHVFTSGGLCYGSMFLTSMYWMASGNTILGSGQTPGTSRAQFLITFVHLDPWGTFLEHRLHSIGPYPSVELA